MQSKVLKNSSNSPGNTILSRTAPIILAIKSGTAKYWTALSVSVPFILAGIN